MTFHLYKHFGADGSLLYVGMTGNLLARTKLHLYSSRWFCEVSRIEAKRFYKKRLAARAERVAILHENPIHNKLLVTIGRYGYVNKLTNRRLLRMIETKPISMQSLLPKRSKFMDKPVK